MCNAHLDPPQTLHAGEFVKSCDGRFTFVMQTDGNLVLYGPSGALWSSVTAGTPANVAVMQNDGNLVLYKGSTAYWSSNTAHHPGAYLVVQDNGNTVIYDGSTQIWSTGTCCH